MPISVNTTDTFERTWKVTWTFEADLRRGVEVRMSSEDDVPLDLPGRWWFTVTRLNNYLTFRLHWDNSLIGAASFEGVTINARLDALYTTSGKSAKRTKQVDKNEEELKNTFPAKMSSTIFLVEVADSVFKKLEPTISLETQRSWKLTVEFKTKNMAVVMRPRAAFAASASSSSVTSRSTNNVRLYFPGPDLELWTTESILSDASPYFKRLFAAGVDEPTPGRGKRRKSESPIVGRTELKHEDVDPVQEEEEFEDADLEVDAIYSEEGKAMVEPGEIEYREITIPASTASYSTYRALLTWLTTSHIDFAPPVVPSMPAAELPAPSSPSRKTQLKEFHDANPLLPIPVSPKSVYRLSHILEIPLLQARALEGYKLELNAETVANEFVLRLVHSFPSLRCVAIEVAAKDFGKVKTSSAMMKVKEDMKGDTARSARFGTCMAELLDKVTF